MTSLLPSNRTAWEAAVEQVSAERRALPTHLVSDVWNPDTCPVDMLPYLAWQMSLDIWDDAWPEVKKRETIRKALHLHRIKTTLAGIKAHVELAGSEVKRAIRPPAREFLYAAMTEEMRRAWLDTLPQVRIYPFYNRAVAVRRHFFSGPGGRQFHSSRNFGSVPLIDNAGNVITDGNGNALLAVNTSAYVERGGEPASDARFFISGFYRSTRARALLGKRATYYDRGVEREIEYEIAPGTAVERVYIGARRKRAWHTPGTFSKHLTSSKAANQVVTVKIDVGSNLIAVTEGMTPVDVRPQREAMERVAPAARSFFGRHRAGRFMLGSFAPLMIYDRISIHTPDRLGARRKTRSYHGHGRYGIPEFTAELRIHVPMRRGRRRSGRWHGAGYRAAADMTMLTKAIEAVRVSKAFRDTVMIDTATYGQVKFSGGLRFGDFTFGEIKEVS